MTVQSSEDLFYYDLCAQYDVEQKLAKMLPTLAQECQQQPEVKKAFLQHEKETQQQINNLEQCFKLLGRSPKSIDNHVVEGLKEDHDAFIQQKPSEINHVMFDLSAGCKSEHIEMAAYHGLIEAAKTLGLNDCVPLFEENLKQEEASEKKLTMLAKQLAKQKA